MTSYGPFKFDADKKDAKEEENKPKKLVDPMWVRILVNKNKPLNNDISIILKKKGEDE